MSEATEVAAEVTSAVEAIEFKAFLESVHPSRECAVTGVFVVERIDNGFSVTRAERVAAPELRLHCSECGGDRTFRVTARESFHDKRIDAHLLYRCGDCHTCRKRYSVHLIRTDESGSGVAFKYGEFPAFGVPVPPKLLRLFGRDSKMFLKGRQAENQGMGVGAFAYYRRVVETHKNDIFDAIIGVCETIGSNEELIAELIAAKHEISFTKSMEIIRTALPQGLLIRGQNPLLALHSALSIGLHDQTDEECLATAQAVRLVLSDLVEKMAMLRQDDKALKDALQVLLSQKAPVDQTPPKTGA